MDPNRAWANIIDHALEISRLEEEGEGKFPDNVLELSHELVMLHDHLASGGAWPDAKTAPAPKPPPKPGFRITKDDVTFEVHAYPEDMRLEGNAMASGDEALDKQVCDEIRARLERGDVWAWCIVRVTATVTVHYTCGACSYADEVSTSDELGGCSYESERDFVSDAYYEDMCANLVYRLNTMARALVDGKVRG